MDEEKKSVIDYLKEQETRLEELNEKIELLNDKHSNKPIISEEEQARIELRNFVNRALIRYGCKESKKTFDKIQDKAAILLTVLIIIIAINSLVISLLIKTYSTFTLIEDLFLIQVIVVFIRLGSTKYNTNQESLKTNSLLISGRAGPFVVFINNEKWRYKIVRWFIYICSVGNCIGISALVDDKGTIIIVSILESLFIIITLICFVLVKKFYRTFEVVSLTAVRRTDEKLVTIYYDQNHGKFYTDENISTLYPNYEKEVE